MVNKAIAGVGSLAIVGGAIVATLVTTQENFVYVDLNGIPSCTLEDGEALGTLGVLTASFNPSCAEGTSLQGTYAQFKPIESGPTTDFWPLFPSQTVFGGIFGDETEVEFKDCESFYNDDAVTSEMASKVVVPTIVGGIEQVEAGLLQAKAEILEKLDNATGAIVALFGAQFTNSSDATITGLLGEGLHLAVGAALTGQIAGLTGETTIQQAAGILGPIAGDEDSPLQGAAGALLGMLGFTGAAFGDCVDPAGNFFAFVSGVGSLESLKLESVVGPLLCPLGNVAALGSAGLLQFVQLTGAACLPTQTFTGCAIAPNLEFVGIPKDLAEPWGFCPLLVQLGVVDPPEDGLCTGLHALSGEDIEIDGAAQLIALVEVCLAPPYNTTVVQECIDATTSLRPASTGDLFPLCVVQDPPCDFTWAQYLEIAGAGALVTPIEQCGSSAGCGATFNGLIGAFPSGIPGIDDAVRGLAAQGFNNFIDGTTTEELIAACKDDDEDAAAIEQAQLLMPIAIGALGVGAIAGFATVCTGKRSLGLIGCVLALGGVALVLVSLLGVQGAPVYDAVGQPADEGETEYKNGLGSSTLAFIAIGAPALGAILLGASSCCNNDDDDEAALTSKVDNTY